MLTVALWTVFCLAVGLFTVQAHSRRPVPDSEWSPDAALWLARAQVAEGGWASRIDHDSIAWVLARRWREAPPGTRFETVIVQYCNSLDAHRPRAAWLLTLERKGRPEGWPRGMSWEQYEPLWQGVLERVELWFAGEVGDPTGGRAVHWDMRTAPVPRGCALLPLNTRNAFYECAR